MLTRRIGGYIYIYIYIALNIRSHFDSSRFDSNHGHSPNHGDCVRLRALRNGFDERAPRDQACPEATIFAAAETARPEATIFAAAETALSKAGSEATVDAAAETAPRGVRHRSR